MCGMFCTWTGHASGVWFSMSFIGTWRYSGGQTPTLSISLFDLSPKFDCIAERGSERPRCEALIC